MTAAEAMTRELLNLTHREQVPPCAHNPDAWVSEDKDQRATAARTCQTCPLLNPCADFAAELKPRFGVWAGVDRTPATRKAHQ
jgi:Transcription factor WhiB